MRHPSNLNLTFYAYILFLYKLNLTTWVNEVAAFSKIPEDFQL